MCWPRGLQSRPTARNRSRSRPRSQRLAAGPPPSQNRPTTTIHSELAHPPPPRNPPSQLEATIRSAPTQPAGRSQPQAQGRRRPVRIMVSHPTDRAAAVRHHPSRERPVFRHQPSRKRPVFSISRAAASGRFP
jgi:hypothetical protein